MKSNRKIFLEHYFKIFGMEKLEWINETENSIRGIVVYDKADLDERQEFVWKKSENEIPSEKLNFMIDKLISEKLLIGDKLIKPTAEIEFAEFDNSTKEKLFAELFNVGINMVDNGKETDMFYLHD
ncbi:hypothetical protein [Polaribacter aestuariivivens]|nr:hypothetical protein [Polaribacter aestuariivivens]